ncbi:E3 ubiquitin/ISG15 ligase TRIM25-like [Xenentodon cancila]
MAFSSEIFDCSICLQTLDDPVTTACGHTYCMKCIYGSWNIKENKRRPYSCPQCRKTFSSRPDLQKNTLLANLLEEHMKKTSESATSDEDEDSYTAPGDVQCDVCTGRKRKAQKFCLVCKASYCKTHLEPHLNALPLKKHCLAQASTRFKENLCSIHDRPLEFYCRTDQQLFCPLCVLEHKSHDIVTAEEEINAKKREVEKTREDVSVKRMVAESKITQLMNAKDEIRDAAWKASNDLEQRCSEQIRLFSDYMKKKCVEMTDKVGEMEKDGVDWIKRRLGELEREVHEQRTVENKLHQLSQTEDATKFFQGFQDLDHLNVLADSQEEFHPLEEFVNAQKDKFEQLSPSPPTDATLEMDPDTVHTCLHLSNTKREISWGRNNQAHPNHPDRFAHFYQVLCQKGLKNNRYWEVKWDGGIVEVAMSYKGISRKTADKASCFGHNEMSWKLVCAPSGCTFWHNNLHKGQIPPAFSRRVGVHLQYDQGKLSFYSVSEQDRLTLLHRVQTTFTEPLYAGFSVDLGAALEICKI